MPRGHNPKTKRRNHRWLRRSLAVSEELLRVKRSGMVEEIASGLSLPTAMTFGPDGDLYVSNWGFGPPNMGEIVRITIPGDDKDDDSESD